MSPLQPNEGKQEFAVVDGVRYQRLPIKTHLITKDDDIVEVVFRYGSAVVNGPDDVLFLSKKCVSCAQGRATPLADIHPRSLATWLSSRIPMLLPKRLGIAFPESMEMVMQELGTLRILFAAFVSFIGQKIFKKKNWFYKVAGYKACFVDAPCHTTIPPYNHYVILAPEDPGHIAAVCAARLGCRVIVTDVNDLYALVLGTSDPGMDLSLYARILKDNPLGQDSQQTPMGIIRTVR